MVTLYAYMQYKQLEAVKKHAMQMESLRQASEITKEMVEIYDQAASEFQKRRDEMYQALQEAQEYFKIHGRKASLQTLRQQLMSGRDGSIYDIYLIDNDFTIERTTYAPDLGLDFRHLPHAFSILKEVYQTPGMIDLSPVFHDAIAIDLKRYIVQRAENADFMVQLSLTMAREYSMHEDIKNLQNDTPNLVRTMAFQHFLGSQVVFNVEKQWSLDYSDLTKQERLVRRKDYEVLKEMLLPMMDNPSEEVDREALAAFLQKQKTQKRGYVEAFFWEDDRYIHRIAMFFNSYLNTFDESTNLLVMEFDETKYQDILQEMKMTSLGVFFMLLLLVGLLINTLRKRVILPIMNMRSKMKKKAMVDDTYMLDRSDEIGLMALTYNQLLRDLNREITSNEELLETFQQFAGNAIHQIRTPVSIIKIALEMIETSNESAKMQIRSSLVMLEHIYDTISYTLQHDAIDFPSQSMDFTAFLRARIAMFLPVVTANDMQIQVNTDDRIILDFNPTEAEFLIDNNLSNAIKYGKPNTTITVTLFRHGNEVVLSFENIGDPIKDTHAIFERYYREDSSRRGSGIGLNMVKAICEKNKVLIQVESIAGTNRFSYYFSYDDVNVTSR